MDAISILSINYATSCLIGLIYGVTYPNIRDYALNIVSNWDFSIEYFVRSILCGMIMYLAVLTYNKYNSPIGIFLGVPLFILCGFQHSIANAVIMGVANSFNPSIILCIIGNWVGSLIIRFLSTVK